MMEVFVELIKGFSLNIIITVLSMFLPLVIGILFSFLVKKKQAIGKVFWWLNIPFQSICIPVLMVLIYYLPGLLLNYPIFARIDRFFYLTFGLSDVGRLLLIIIILPIAYLMYMPARYNNEFSFAKNILYNGLGLISNLFKWSFISSMFIVPDAIYVSENFAATQANIIPIIITVLSVSIIIIVIETGRVLIKQFMK